MTSRTAAAPIVRAALDRVVVQATARAGSVLSEMSGRPVHVSATDLARDAGRVSEGLAGLDHVTIGIHVRLTGAFAGRALFLLALASARRLSSLLLEGLDGAAPEEAVARRATLDPLAVSALEEVGNVAVTAVANELSAHLGGPVEPSVPRTDVGSSRSMLDAMVRDLTSGDDGVPVVLTTFSDDSHEIQAMLLMVSDPTMPLREETAQECSDG